MSYEFENKELFTSVPSKVKFQIKLESSIVDYYKRGFKCIPCRLEIDSARFKDSKKHVDFGLNSSGKYRKWGEAVLQLDHQVDALRTFKSASKGLPANAIAIITGTVSNLFVIDLDAPKEKAFKYLMDAGIKVYNDTYSIDSPNGGCHLYFKYDKRLDDYPSTSAKFFGKDSPVDIRSNGGLIFAYPSQIYNKDINKIMEYKIHTDPEDPLKKLRIYDAPDIIIKMIINRNEDRKHNEKVNLADCTKNIEKLSPAQQEWLQKDINKVKDAEKGARSEVCYGLVCTLIKLKLDKEVARSICAPLSKFAERPDLFDRIYTTAAAGIDVAKYDYTSKKFNIGSDGRQVTSFDQTPISEDEMTALALKILNRDKKLAPLDWLVPNFMAKKMLAILAGPPGIGKTLALLDACKCIASASNNLFGCISVTVPKKILYIQFELNENIFVENYIKRLDMEELNNFDYLCRDSVVSAGGGISLTLDKENTSGRYLFERFIKETDADMVVIDSLKHCFSGEINKSEVMSELLMWLKSLTSKHNKFILLVHHLRKRSMLRRGEIPAEYTLDDLAGSGTIASTVDFAYAINEVFSEEESRKIDKKGKICSIKQGSVGESLLKEAIYTICNSTDDKGNSKVSIVYNSSLEEIDTGSIKYKILLILYHNPNINSKVILEKAGLNATMSSKTYYDILNDLEKSQYIVRYGKTRNQYTRLTDTGRLYIEGTFKPEIEELDMGQKKADEERTKFLLSKLINTKTPGVVTPMMKTVRTLEYVYCDHIGVEINEDCSIQNQEFKECIDNLMDQGYINIFEAGIDHMVELTAQGRDIIKRMFPQHFMSHQQIEAPRSSEEDRLKFMELTEKNMEKLVKVAAEVLKSKELV